MKILDSYTEPYTGSRQIGPRQIGPRTVGPRTIGPRTVGPRGPTVRGPICHFFRADSWAPDNWAPGPNCPGPNLPLFQGGQLGPGAQLFGAQFATFSRLTDGLGGGIALANIFIYAGKLIRIFFEDNPTIM